jgi:hypothetical protein
MMRIICGVSPMLCTKTALLSFVIARSEATWQSLEIAHFVRNDTPDVSLFFGIPYAPFPLTGAGSRIAPSALPRDRHLELLYFAVSFFEINKCVRPFPGNPEWRPKPRARVIASTYSWGVILRLISG